MTDEELDIERIFEEEEKPSALTAMRARLRAWWERVQERRLYSEATLQGRWLLAKQFLALLLAVFYCYVTLELYKRSSVYLIVFVPTIYSLFDYIRQTRGGR